MKIYVPNLFDLEKAVQPITRAGPLCSLLRGKNPHLIKAAMTSLLQLISINFSCLQQQGKSSK
jgi:hypothetical protein